ncbi:MULTISPECIES: DUF3369 domain-containing protein [Pseudoalteromonas]|uniref:Phosphodiesterase n=1 Tax=Pseudoalteromonas peptidolytica F12-50-A1 TaxID=1315280 RepID=A0A8I0MTU1_9GAMM|nr:MULTISPECIES: DUF3369 domain-containing protein [Pseudoalteromonas]MBE0345283.1 hypothetical protein [Pseudoalteromonas peptidolytica F12-50-A1]MDW7547380.1 DUF3369 domain-containing protein [Pseudoalteromonas peptidolytica]NLR16871.1 DUF3369 domain-containing protein [Pseudoalteromonas peptidolytica]RXF05893.1 DUF3369 domain-containing protein [Pseudoalteromonas sp. PS5]GEK11071.1 phosphodiesterase [Pseudoalteromonas peptidolytica]
MSGFLFSDEVPESPTNNIVDTYWDILVVDDEEDIHQVTKLVLSGFKFEDKALRFHHAYSAQEAKEILASQQNISVGLIDVVMESNHAGLDLIRYIRNDLENFDIRLVLRTGQPGEAPEESVIRDYDINDYKNKTELTAVKLKTLLYSALRAHRDIQTIEKHKMGLERIIDASSNFLQCSNIQDFASTILSHVSAVMGLSDSEIYCAAAVNHQANAPTKFKLLAASGEGVEPHNGSIPDNVQKLFVKIHNNKTSLKTRNEYIGYFPSQEGNETMIYVSKESDLHTMDFQLLEFFANNIALAYDNLKLRETVKDSQKELSYILGEAVEKRSKETGSHVKRVAHYSMLLGQLYGLSHYHAEIIKLASPLHDIGKISIPDHILNKPGKLTDEEWLIMQTHAQQGYEILKNSTNEILQCGALIAHQHHEKWDGSGYPQGLKGEQINIVGRITALADVFDALGSERCYKPAWPLDKIIELVNNEKGKQFDPKLVDLFLNNLEQFIEIRDRYPD